MDPRKPDYLDTDDLPDTITGQDWDAVETGELLPESRSADDDLSLDFEDGDLLEEDDDNPMQGSDEALPEDDDEAVLRRDPSKEGSRFDEV